MKANRLPTHQERLSKMLKALGNPIRFQIVETLAERQTCITNEIVLTTNLAQSTVSQHLKVLREAGLIHGEVEGAATCYCLDAEGVQFLKNQIESWLPQCCEPASMTPASIAYFGEVAGQWDEIRSGYFDEAVRAAGIAKAYLHPDMAVADVGAGTGFLTAGLAPLVREVHVLDGSPAMLEQARQNLANFTNVEYHLADGAALPLPDASLDAVFANMYLHHLPEPLAGIREMARLLKPGGRLVITDMDSHPHAWMKTEMADAWQGFERSQVRAWFDQAGLVNVIAGDSGQSCCAESQQATLTSPAGQQAQVSIFLAVGSRRVSGARSAVEANYGAAALTPPGAGSCCTPSGESSAMNLVTSASSCCGGASSGSATSSCCGADGASGLISLDAIDVPAGPEIQVTFNPNYTSADSLAVPAEAAELALGCGNPTALAAIQPGELVLDIGSGAGMDAFLAAHQVGPGGKVIGVDMTPAMLERARRGAAKAGLQQVEFRQGQAEALPVEDGSVDVIISNCVINLTEDKGLVFREAYRVLKPGGRLEVSDVVTSTSFPPHLRSDPAAWSGCVFGALPEAEYLDLVAQAGFSKIHTRRTASSGQAGGVEVYSLAVSAQKAR